MPARIDLYTLDRLATVTTRARLATLTAADLDRPSPCVGWNIRNLLSHLVGGNLRFGQALRGQPTREQPTGPTDGQPKIECGSPVNQMFSILTRCMSHWRRLRTSPTS